MKIIHIRSRRIAAAALPSMLLLSLAFGDVLQGRAQARPTAVSTKMAAPLEPSDGRPAKDGSAKDGTPASGAVPDRSAGATEPDVSSAVLQELEAMKLRIAQLEAELKARTPPAASEQPPALAGGAFAKASVASPVTPVSTPALAVTQTANDSPAKPPEPSKPTEPFAYADWTWLNGTPRTKDAVWDSKFFTPEIRFDTDFVSSFNHPKDDSLGGSTEIFRSNEIQVEQISFGGDFHWQNIRGRVLTLGGHVWGHHTTQ